MNVYDSERMGEALNMAGYHPVDAPDKADMVILNTCHIREKAAEKVYSELGRLKKLKDINEDMIIGVAGCVAQVNCFKRSQFCWSSLSILPFWGDRVDTM